MENKPWTIKPWLWVALRQRKESLFGEQGGLAIELLPHMVQREVGVARPQLAMYAFMVTPLDSNENLNPCFQARAAGITQTQATNTSLDSGP